MLAVVEIGPKCTVMMFFLRSSVYSAKFGSMHAAVAVMAGDNHVPQFPEGARGSFFSKNS